MPFRPFHVAVYQCKHQVMFERLCGFQHSTCIQATLRSTTFASSQALGTAPFQLSPQPTIPPPSPTHQCQEKNKSSRTRDESQQIAAQTPLSCLQYPVQIKSSARDFRARVDSVIIRGGGAGRDPAPPIPASGSMCHAARALHTVPLRRASGLEAFSRTPTQDSVSAMPGRATECASRANRRFLSYWVELLWGRRRISVG